MKTVVHAASVVLAAAVGLLLHTTPALAWDSKTYDSPWDCTAYFASSPTSYGAAAYTERQSGNQCSPMYVRWRYSSGGYGLWNSASNLIFIESSSSSGKLGASHKICNGCSVFTT